MLPWGHKEHVFNLFFKKVSLQIIIPGFILVIEIFHNLFIIKWLFKDKSMYFRYLFILQRYSHFLLIRNIKNNKKQKKFQVRTFPCDEFTRKNSSFLFKSTISYSFLMPHKKLLLTYSSFLTFKFAKSLFSFFRSYYSVFTIQVIKLFINIISHHV